MSYLSCLCHVCVINFVCVLAACNQISNDQRCAMSELSIEEYEDAKAGAAAVNLIQRHPILAKSGGRRVHTSILPPSDYLEAATPLAWTHVPKCGSTFINSLVRLPGVCPGLITNETDIVWNIDSLDSSGNHDPEQPNWNKEFPDWDERCPGLRKLPGIYYLGQHASVGSYFDAAYDGRGVIMLRQPEQRTISMYNYLLSGGEARGVIFSFLPDLLKASDFAKKTEGCVVRMLTREPQVSPQKELDDAYDGEDWVTSYCVKSVMSDIPFASDVKEARLRLRGYAFVGITEEWQISICLLHAMFGGQCNSAEFSNVRGQRSSNETAYDTSVLEGFVDQYDGELYEEALSIFSKNLELYGVSEESCQQCFEAAGI